MTAMSAAPGTAPGAVQPQHAVLVLPSTGEFDSRTYRIATTLLARGHRVTVLARWSRGLPREETVPAGYTIVRIPVSAVEGLPFPRLFAIARTGLRLLRGGRRRAPSAPGPSPATASDDSSATATVPAAPARRASMPRRLYGALVRRLAIPLTIRAHIRLAGEVAPAADLYHGMAYMGIPVALALGKRHHGAVVYDARDIYLEARNMARMNRLARWALARAERGWALRSSRVITVNDAYADVMAKLLRVRRPLVVMNCSYRYEPPRPPVRRFQELLGLPDDRRVVLYHGGLFPHRGIEELMTAMRDVPGATLVLMGYGVLEPALREAATGPGLTDRVRFAPPVRPDELLDWVAAADVVAMPIQASTLNHRLTTPNKLFEAMAAGVPVVASDLPGMATIVRETDCGVLCDPADPSSIAAGIRRILEAGDDQRRGWSERAIAASHETYNWERQAGILLDEYGRLTGRAW
jgi:glycosyltransferase involved in cell wall biosynthesis